MRHLAASQKLVGLKNLLVVNVETPVCVVSFCFLLFVLFSFCFFVFRLFDSKLHVFALFCFFVLLFYFFIFSSDINLSVKYEFLAASGNTHAHSGSTIFKMKSQILCQMTAISIFKMHS